MNKKEGFLWAVQTMFLSEQIKTSTISEIVNSKRGALGIHYGNDNLIIAALNGCDHIPEDMTAYQAAYELFSSHENGEIPNWCKVGDASDNVYEHPRIRSLKN